MQLYNDVDEVSESCGYTGRRVSSRNDDSINGMLGMPSNENHIFINSMCDWLYLCSHKSELIQFHVNLAILHLVSAYQLNWTLTLKLSGKYKLNSSLLIDYSRQLFSNIFTLISPKYLSLRITLTPKTFSFQRRVLIGIEKKATVTSL